MYDVKPNLIIGFHGCDADVCNTLLNNPDSIKISKKPYDWLGFGMYFWENNYDRALQWAQEKKLRGAIRQPAVIGALLQPGYCCFLETKFIDVLTSYHKIMAAQYQALNVEMPQNKDLPHDRHNDRILRLLDCATIEFMHAEILNKIKKEVREKGYSKNKIFDSTRGAFIEGGPAYEGAGIFEKTHIQICIRNLNCIKGFFPPQKGD